MILTKCAACAAPLAHDAPRCVRCKTRYCDSTCQHDHWRRGHKQICKKIHRGGNAEQYHADKKYKEAVAVAVEECDHFGDIRLDESCRVRANVDYSQTHHATGRDVLPVGTFLAAACAGVVTLFAMACAAYMAYHEDHEEDQFRKRLSQTRSESMIRSEDSERRESRTMTTSTNAVLGGAGPGAPTAPGVAVKRRPRSGSIAARAATRAGAATEE